MARIAIACSGLGHVRRGIESWASDLAHALTRSGHDVTLFCGGPTADGTVVPNLRRTGAASNALARSLRHLGAWRYGMGSTYDVEQTSFSLGLWRQVRRDYDILHVQDPLIATWLNRANRLGLSRPKVIYANGTGENGAVMGRFSFLQLLTPAVTDDWYRRKPQHQRVFTIPNFIDTQRFQPGDQATARARFNLPLDARVVLCCAAIRRTHKRIDRLMQEFATIPSDAVLVIAGGREDETDDLIAEGAGLLGSRIRFLPNLPRDLMPDLYRAADAFVLPSLYEMFGIVLLEALATELPVLCHDTPDFRTVAGPGGIYRDFGAEGELAKGLALLLDPNACKQMGKAGRAHVEQRYSEGAVMDAITSMYQAVLADSSRAR
jgi:glycosyltransferase involved in cell wall biosynthesis